MSVCLSVYRWVIWSPCWVINTVAKCHWHESFVTTVCTVSPWTADALPTTSTSARCDLLSDPLPRCCEIPFTLSINHFSPTVFLIVAKLDSPRWFSHILAQCHICGGMEPGDGGGYHFQIWTRVRFSYNAPTPTFHHPMFIHSEVIMLTNKQTNKQTDAAENIQCSTTLGLQHDPTKAFSAILV